MQQLISRKFVGSPGAWLRCARYAATGIALVVGSTLAAQMVSIPLGGPRPQRPSPNAGLLGAPADIAGALETRRRSPAERSLDEARHPAEVLTFLGLSNRVRAFVVERDPGYFGAIIGAAIGNGRVTELLPAAALQDPAARAAVSNEISLAPGLTPLAVAPAALRLAPGSLDFVLLDLAFDRLSSATAPDARAADIAAFIQKLFSAVRPGGIVGVVGDPAPSDDPRADAATGSAASKVRADFSRAGFILDNAGRLRGDDGGSAATDEPAAPPRFILRFRKPE
nr:hypothetical protein [Polymorphobacter sp.]